jgi:L-ascorbate metabolism protein UlaG (beta-lactamase superfamily)
MLYILGFVAVFFLFIAVVGYFLSAPKYTGEPTDHFNGKQFINPGNTRTKGFPELVRWMLKREQGEWKARYDLPYGERPATKVEGGIRVTFVNHSTFLIQTEGLNILTDPVWSDRTSPFSWAGPRRMRPPGIKFSDLPPIDVVLISHNHYDHLDLPSLRAIAAKHNPAIITPLGVKAFLEKENIKGARDLDWWEEVTLRGSFNVQAVPAQHFSGRGMFDRDATLWCGYVLKRKEGNIYFAADTGYNEDSFKKIGKACAPIQLAFIPIGAYKPAWFLVYVSNPLLSRRSSKDP